MSNTSPTGASEVTIRDKKRLREAMIRQRAEAPAEWRRDASIAITRRALALEARIRAGSTGSRSVSVFVGKQPEVDTSALIAGIIENHGSVIVPRVIVKDQSLALHRASSFPAGFHAGAYGILEPEVAVYPESVPPEQIDLIFVPGVAFDRHGNRLGHGKGFYDRLLARTVSAVKIGLGFSFQLVDDLPREPHDVLLDVVITENETLDFGIAK